MTREKDAALALVRSRRRALQRARRAEARARDQFEAAVVEAAGAGGSQRETASQAGVSQPYVARILAAAGPARFVPSSRLGRRLVDRRDRVLDTVREYGADNVRVFGSLARGEDRPGSDIDLIVDLAPGTGLFGLARMEHALEKVLGVDVDLVPGRLLATELQESVRHDVVPL